MYSISNKKGHLNYHTLPVIRSKTLYTYINTTTTTTITTTTTTTAAVVVVVMEVVVVIIVEVVVVLVLEMLDSSNSVTISTLF